MSRIRNEVLSGIAAVSMLGAANVARADDHRLKPEIQRHQGQDGRGDTAAFRQGVIRPEQIGIRAPDRAQPVKPYVDSCARPLPLKAEVRAHFSEMPESMKMLSVTPSGASDDTRSAEQRTVDRARIMAQLPMKTEISMRISDSREGEGNPSANPNAQGSTDDKVVHTSDAAKTAISGQSDHKGSSNRMLGLLPVKNEIKMRMHSGGDGQADER